MCKRVVLASALVLGGCGFGGWGPKFASYDDVPANQTRLYVYRNSQYFTRDITVQVDGRTLAELSPGTYLSVLLEPRALPFTYKLTADLPWTLSPTYDAALPPSPENKTIEKEHRVRRVETHPGATVFCGFIYENHYRCRGVIRALRPFGRSLEMPLR